ncbi:GTPase [Nostoc sp. NMS4]|uniref:GTPase n=1 Tax=Nostoc sp. NMS4 TaxID=2815390 RepID=UPI0025DD197A|nr:GTPase [Nostoc sp. NMS4]MBN3922380.1 50S ribosome-binding GTPase [Nostoc sp. NMS4]
MVNTPAKSVDEESFFEQVENQLEEKVKDFSKTLNIAVIGKVSSGKSSLINALLKRNRDNALIVGAEAGITKNLTVLRLDDRVRLIDSPGLDDVRSQNSEVTKEFLKHIDVGILVVTASSESSQKKYLDDLQKHCDSVFVVLNKIDEYDRYTPEALAKVVEQWKKDLNIQKIYRFCAFGYDPDISPDVPLDIRDIDWLRYDIQDFLVSKGKDLLLARHMGDKEAYANGIITTALLSVTVEAFLPGSAAIITATQAAAIASLYYLYTGEIISLKTVVGSITTFATEAGVKSILLWIQSLLPPNGVTNIAAAGIAVTITLAMLATVKTILANGAKIQQEELLRQKFQYYRKKAEQSVKNLAFSEWNDRKAWGEIISTLNK